MIKVYVAKKTSGIFGDGVGTSSTSSAETGNTMRYDSTSGQYVYNLAKRSLSGEGTYQLRIDVGDGTTHIVQFGVKR